MCSDSYPIPILSLFFLCHPYILYFLIQRMFSFSNQPWLSSCGFKSGLSLKVKVQIGILECTGMMGQDLVHPYIQSTTVLCDNFVIVLCNIFLTS